MKLCQDCKMEKPLEAFVKKASCIDGYEPRCRVCRSIKYNKSSLELVVKKIYNAQKSNSRKRGHPQPDYSLEDLTVWVRNHPAWEDIYSKWVSSKYLKNLAPSIDRLDINKPYSLDNIDLITWEQNHDRGRKDMLNGIDPRQLKPVKALHPSGELYKAYFSISEAVREINGTYWGISTVANAKPVKDGRGKWYQPKTYKGFVWVWG